MSDRRVVYKTAVQRVIESVLVGIMTCGLAALWHLAWPAISTSYVIVAALILGYCAVSWCGSRLAEQNGAPLITVEERTRRYLRELGPIGLSMRPGYSPARSRRSQGRSTRRG